MLKTPELTLENAIIILQSQNVKYHREHLDSRDEQITIKEVAANIIMDLHPVEHIDLKFTVRVGC